MSEKHILLTDSDATTAEELRLALGPDWTVESVTTGAAALQKLRTGRIEILMTSLQLPDMTPAQLLNRVRNKHPKTLRFVLATEHERRRMVKEVLGAHQFLTRPFEAQSLRSSLELASSSNKWIESEQLRKLIARMRTLPTIPALYLDIVAALKSANTTTEDVGALIGQDMAITTKLLQVINSAYFGLPRTVTSPADAVSLLGFETAKSMVVAVKLLNQYDRINPDTFSIDDLWHHSTSVAHLSRRLVLLQTGDRILGDEAFGAGLLHDIGKAVLAANFGEQYAGAESLARKRSLPMCEVEKEFFGATHSEVGAFLLSLWGLSNNVLEAAAFHHEPSGGSAPGFSVLTAVHAANALYYIENSDCSQSIPPIVDLHYLDTIGLSDSLRPWCEELLGPEKTAEHFAIDQCAAVSAVPQASLAFTAPPAPVLSISRPQTTSTSTASGELQPIVETTQTDPSQEVDEVSPEDCPQTGLMFVQGLAPEQPQLSQASPVMRRNPWLIATAVPAALLILGCVLFVRWAHEHHHSFTVQARESNSADNETKAPDRSAEPITTQPLEAGHKEKSADVANTDSPAVLTRTEAPPPRGSTNLAHASLAPVEPRPEPIFPDLKLQGIIFSKRPAAIINGLLVHPNETIGGVRIAEIRAGTVIIEYQKERRTLALEN